MKRFVVISVVLSIILFLFGCASHEQQLQEKGLKALNQTELEKLFSIEKTGTVRTTRATSKVKYYPDGKQEVAWSGGSDTGTYKLRNNQFCSSWRIIRSDELCVKFYNVGENKYDYVSRDGHLEGTLEFK